jgi:outer membrane protein OmpU
MKKVLLGTSALCAVAFAGPASAADPIKLTIGGYWKAGYGDIVSENGTPSRQKRHDGIKMDDIVRFDGNTKLDNGITVGVSVQVRAENRVPSAAVQPSATATTGVDTIKRTYAFFRGDFGEFRIGDDDDARRQKAFGAPQAGGVFGTNSPTANFNDAPAVGTNSTFAVVDTTSRVTRLIYFTPTFAGFSFAVSYAPDGSKGGGGVGGNTQPTINGAAGTRTQNSLSAAASYSSKFGDFTFDAYAGVSRADQKAAAAFTPGYSRNNKTIWAGGAKVGWGPLQFGGAYEETLKANNPVGVPAATTTPNGDNKVFDLGVLYTVGPFSTSANWSRGQYNGLVGAQGVTLNEFELIGAYALGPGITLEAAIEFSQYRAHTATPAGTADTSAAHDTTSTALMAGTAINF